MFLYDMTVLQVIITFNHAESCQVSLTTFIPLAVTTEFTGKFQCALLQKVANSNLTLSALHELA